MFVLYHILAIKIPSCLFSVDRYCVFVSQSHVVCLLRLVRRLHLRRPARHEGASEAEPAKAVDAVVSVSGHLQVSPPESTMLWARIMETLQLGACSSLFTLQYCRSDADWILHAAHDQNSRLQDLGV